MTKTNWTPLIIESNYVLLLISLLIQFQKKIRIKLLSKGLAYGIKNNNFNHFEILARFEEFAQNVINDQQNPDFIPDKSSINLIDSFLQKLQFQMQDYINCSKTPLSSLTFDETKTLHKLKEKVVTNKLIINKADKGNAAVVSSRAAYIEKVEKILSDTSKFQVIENPSPNIVEELETTFNNRLHKISDVIDKDRTILDENNKKIEVIKQKGSINQQLYKQLRSCGAKIGVCYGLFKIHKSDLPIRPIISTIGTHNYNTAKYLSKVLEDHFNQPLSINSTHLDPNNNASKSTKRSFKYAIKDSFDFINKLNNIKLEKDDFLISIDVVSLYTNVPIDETMEIIKNAFFTKKTFPIEKKKSNIGTKHIRLGLSQYDGLIDNLPWELYI